MSKLPILLCALAPALPLSPRSPRAGAATQANPRSTPAPAAEAGAKVEDDRGALPESGLDLDENLIEPLPPDPEEERKFALAKAGFDRQQQVEEAAYERWAASVDPRPRNSFPRIGTCYRTRVKHVGNRFELPGNPRDDVGSAILYENAFSQVGYGLTPEIARSRPGDRSPSALSSLPPTARPEISGGYLPCLQSTDARALGPGGFGSSVRRSLDMARPSLRSAICATLVGAALALLLPAGLSAAPGKRRIPPDYKWGRCLFVVEGQVRIKGACTYRIEKGGDFQINGPRQVYEGIDFPRGLIMAGHRSADYWAEVYKDFEGVWTGYGNESIGAVHGTGPRYGPLRRRGACWVSNIARICLWKQ